MTDKMIKIQGYKCPYCEYENTRKDEMSFHMETCRKNTEYTQKCIKCSLLERDWLTRKVYDNKSICLYDEKTCPFANHDTTEIDNIIEEHKAEMQKYEY